MASRQPSTLSSSKMSSETRIFKAQNDYEMFWQKPPFVMYVDRLEIGREFPKNLHVNKLTICNLTVKSLQAKYISGQPVVHPNTRDA